MSSSQKQTWRHAVDLGKEANASLKGEGARVFIHQTLMVIDTGLLVKGISSSKLPASFTISKVVPEVNGNPKAKKCRSWQLEVRPVCTDGINRAYKRRAHSSCSKVPHKERVLGHPGETCGICLR